MRFEKLLELLESLGFEYDAAFEGEWIVFQNFTTNTVLRLHEDDANIFEVVQVDAAVN